MNRLTRIMLGGDVMLGRLVKEAIVAEGIDYPMGQIASLMRQGDLTLVNLECTITTHPSFWHGRPKAFYFGAPPEAADILAKSGVHLVSLANNHILDYDVKGLTDTLRYLDQYHIAHAGAGVNRDEALMPACLQINGIQFGMVAFCDHQSDFAAGKNLSGMAYLNLNDEETALQQMHSSLAEMRKAGVDWAILSLHWGPNMVHSPSEKFMHIAHAAIEMGYNMLFGHSAHVFHGVEIYRGCPIIYSAGDLVDDYYVDPDFKNDHQLLFDIVLLGKNVKQINLYPVFIENCQTKLASGEQFEYIANTMQRLCYDMGTIVRQQGQGALVIQHD